MEGHSMIKAAALLIVGVSLLQACYGAPKRAWQCTRCKVVYSGDRMPSLKKCPETRFQQFHTWHELEWSLSTDVAADQPLHDQATHINDSTSQ